MAVEITYLYEKIVISFLFLLKTEIVDLATTI